MKPNVDFRGVPTCSEDECPEYDGKRCKLTGFRPDRICEPAVREIVAIGDFLKEKAMYHAVDSRRRGMALPVLDSAIRSWNSSVISQRAEAPSNA